MMSQNIKYTTAELLSFQEVPETCDEIDRALRLICELELSIMKDELASYRIEASDQLCYAIDAIFKKTTNVQVAKVRELIHYKATFPLRLALIKRIEAELEAKGATILPNHYERWLANGLAVMNGGSR